MKPPSFNLMTAEEVCIEILEIFVEAQATVRAIRAMHRRTRVGRRDARRTKKAKSVWMSSVSATD